MPFIKQPHAEPIPGYRLLTPLGSGGFGEVWKCEAPGGLCKAIKFVYGNLNAACDHNTQAHGELQAIQRIKDLRHPFLLSMDRVEWVDGELMIVMELAEKNLYELLVEYQQKGQPGIPRELLLHYLREAAEVLDLMNVQHGLSHLDVKPRNFFVASQHVKVADFGLVTSLTTAGVKVGAVTPVYASPEVFQGKVSGSSDQYSLAICFMELLTGKLPFNGKSSRQLLMQHMKDAPDLSPCGEADRPILGRALAKDPSQRYPSCLDLMRALQGQPVSGQNHGEQNHTHKNLSYDSVPHDSVSITETDTPRFCKAPPAVPAALAGYQFLENQGSSLLADVWKAVAPDGRMRQVKFIYGFTGRDPRGVQEAVRRLQALQHPALTVIEVVQQGPGCLVLVNDLAKETLRERWKKCQSQRLPGIPRCELLGYLHTIAQAIDYLYQQHAIHHLGLNPATLQFVDGSLQVAEFGLAHLFWLPAGQAVGQRNGRYAAPELFEQQVHRSSDQYSLALLYQELLTGVYAFAGHSRTTVADSRGKIKPDLNSLPAGERAVIARALATDVQQRWPSCGDLVRALESAGSAPVSSVAHTAGLACDAFAEIIAAPPVAHASALPGGVGPEALTQILNDLLAQVGPADLSFNEVALDKNGQPVLSSADAVLTHQFRAGLPVGAARVKLDTFRQQANGQLLRDEEEAYDFHVPTPTNFWQQWIGRQPGLDVGVQLARPHPLSATPIDVTVTIKAVRCGKKKAVQLVEDAGTNLLEGLRAFLLVHPDKRIENRLFWPHPLEVRAVDGNGEVGPPISCRGKDISLSGIGFYLPHELSTSQVLIRMPASAQAQPISIPATLVWAQRCADGWYDVGALFRLATLRKSRPEVCISSP